MNTKYVDLTTLKGVFMSHHFTVIEDCEKHHHNKSQPKEKRMNRTQIHSFKLVEFDKAIFQETNAGKKRTKWNQKYLWCKKIKIDEWSDLDWTALLSPSSLLGTRCSTLLKVEATKPHYEIPKFWFNEKKTGIRI